MIPGLPDGLPEGVPSEGLTGEADGDPEGVPADGVASAVPEGDELAVPEGEEKAVPEGDELGVPEGEALGLCDPLPPSVTSRIIVALARLPCSPYQTLIWPSPPLTSRTTWTHR